MTLTPGRSRRTSPWEYMILTCIICFGLAVCALLWALAALLVVSLL